MKFLPFKKYLSRFEKYQLIIVLALTKDSNKNKIVTFVLHNLEYEIVSMSWWVEQKYFDWLITDISLWVNANQNLWTVKKP